MPGPDHERPAPVAEDIMAAHPIGVEAKAILRDSGAMERYLDNREEEHRDLIKHHLGLAGVALAISDFDKSDRQHSLVSEWHTPLQPDITEPTPPNPADNKPSGNIDRVLGLDRHRGPFQNGDHDTPETSATDIWVTKDKGDKKERFNIHELYEAVRHDPEKKMELDIKLVSELLLKLGPTNQFRTRQGLNSAFDLARLQRLLNNDYEALPERKKNPVLRMTEGIVAEEQALLWNESTILVHANKPQARQDMMFNLEDPNLFSEEQIQKLSRTDRWKLIGAKLADESADIFESIVNSGEGVATEEEKAVALCRMTDMRIRSLIIRSKMKQGDKSLEECFTEIRQLHSTYFDVLKGLANKQPGQRGMSDGTFGELSDVAIERDIRILNGTWQEPVRLSVPREDQVHVDVPHIRTPRPNDKRLKLNLDVSFDDLQKGSVADGHELKAMTEAAWGRVVAQEPKKDAKYVRSREGIKFRPTADANYRLRQGSA